MKYVHACCPIVEIGGLNILQVAGKHTLSAQALANMGAQLPPACPLAHAMALLATRGQPEARAKAVRALARAAAEAYKTQDSEGADDDDDTAITLADDTAWTVQAVHLAVASEGLLPAFARTRFYMAATLTLLRHGGSGASAVHSGVAAALATGIASLAAAGDVWEAARLLMERQQIYPAFRTMAMSHTLLRTWLTTWSAAAGGGGRAAIDAATATAQTLLRLATHAETADDVADAVLAALAVPSGATETLAAHSAAALALLETV